MRNAELQAELACILFDRSEDFNATNYLASCVFQQNYRSVTRNGQAELAGSLIYPSEDFNATNYLASCIF